MKKYLLKKIIYLLIFLLLLTTIYIYILILIIDNKFKNDIYKNYSPEIYSEILIYKCNNSYNKNKIIKTLLLSKYRKVKEIKKPGDFLYNKDYIDLFRRSFNFPDFFENKVYIRMIFNKEKLVNIINMNDNINIKEFRLDPQIIHFSNYNNKYKLFLPINFFSKTLKDIIIEIEDKNYYYHNGVSIISIFRAIIKNIKLRRINQGGSTITQQVIKNIFFNCKKSFIRKINELFMSLIIEYKFNKNKILEIYLNNIFFGVIKGKEIYGFPLASLCYFNTPIDELDLNQQSILISMVKGATLYNPYKNIDILKKRRDFILKKINERNIIDNFFYDFLIKQKISFKNSFIENYPSFIKIIKNEAESNNNYFTCKKIFSTLSLISQQSLHKCSKKYLNFLKKNKKNLNLEISMIVIDYKTGEIKSSIGGFNNQYYGFNRVYARRQIGSIIKPIIYLYALKFNKIYKLNTLLTDDPVYYNQENNKIWNPKNSNNVFNGKVKLMDSLIYSLNIPTINLGFSLGIDNIINLIKTLIDNFEIKINKFPSIFLGAINLNLINVSQMYQSIANNGNFIKIFSIKNILNNKNDILYFNKIKKKIFSKKLSYLIMYCMKKVIEKGTGIDIHKNFKYLKLAGKTGTTNKFRDSWFVGIDNKEICVIWIGKDDNSPTNLTFKTGAIKVYQEYIKNNFIESLKIKKPNNIHFLNIDSLGNIICHKHNNKYKIPVWINDPRELTKSCDKHYFFIKYINKFFNIY